MATIREKVKPIETLLAHLCDDPYEQMLLLDHAKNRLVIYITQKQQEARHATETDSGDDRVRVRDIQASEEAPDATPGPGHSTTGTGDSIGGGEVTQTGSPGPTEQLGEEPGEELKGSGRPAGERSYRIPRPGDPDYVAPAPQDRKSKPPRPGEEIPGSFERGDATPPDPTDPDVIVRGAGKVIRCTQCAADVYKVSEDISQVETPLGALRKFIPVGPNTKALTTIDDIKKSVLMETGAMVMDCSECGRENGVTLIPKQSGG